ncbi:hypothetical protein NPX13_g11017 [Xylaria arbuscula]|uniref:Uncharacterized protein n=1 Tax=Xylaria arbuscula TaxID=114810 RepID=A0A9W8TG20_9PEZI|nr:hypothetical protein NPX13_g11017 [Xylaria arbuscula]
MDYYGRSTIKYCHRQKRRRVPSLRQVSNPSRSKKLKTSSTDSSDIAEPHVAKILNLDMATPYKPDSEEAQKYFHGFSGGPKPIARTGHSRWTPSLFESGWNGELAQRLKFYMPLDDEGIIGQWSKELSKDIISALGQCKWSYFFPIRTCLRDEYGRQRTVPATVLLVAVEPGSLQWEDGIGIAIRCRQLLQKRKIFDLEVEIMEDKCQQHDASTDLEALSHPKDTIYTEILRLMSYTGYPIGYLENIPGEGTVGLHVKLGAKSTVYGLTCRHVVCNNRSPQDSYQLPVNGRQYHIQANQSTFEDIVYDFETTMAAQKIWVSKLETNIRKWDEWYQYDPTMADKEPTEADRARLVEGQEVLARHTLMEKVLKMIENRDQRQIGHLAFHPDFVVSSRQHGYLRDWVLIELDPAKFNHLDNKVFLGDARGINTFRTHVGSEVTLTGGIESEIGFASCYPVAKRGAKSGLTFGTKSDVDAVTRQPGYGITSDVYTWEMVIVPEDKVDRFSAKGDSGAIIFDEFSRVVAMVTGSNGAHDDGRAPWGGVSDKDSPSKNPKSFGEHNNELKDADKASASDIPESGKGTEVTFASPIQWILDDIQDFTGQRVRLA